MLDIIIPAYNAQKTINETLSSIVYQKYNFDIHVYIVDDCSHRNYNEFINFYKQFIDIKELNLTENMGPGYARQYGIENSKSKYILFIDSDDVFSCPNSLEMLVNEIEKRNSDVVISDFVEERDEMFFLKADDKIWLHGKIYRRSFLEKNNIKFNNSRTNEDNGFNSLIMLHNSKIDYVSFKTYIWRNNKDSITRKNNYEYLFKGIEGYIYNMNWSLTEGIKNKCDNIKIGELSYVTLISIYLIYIDYYEEKDCKFILQNSKNILNISNKFVIDNSDKNRLINEYLEFYFIENEKTKFFNSKVTFDEFIRKINEVEV